MYLLKFYFIYLKNKNKIVNIGYQLTIIIELMLLLLLNT